MEAAQQSVKVLQVFVPLGWDYFSQWQGLHAESKRETVLLEGGGKANGRMTKPLCFRCSNIASGKEIFFSK